ncbi:MAG: protein-glutamate O-methyltransferase CheR [Oscillospiraceae bacterium]|nr:protein-glutamate O-methyltransferase CheR [Oscillospiraceae bacterium]
MIRMTDAEFAELTGFVKQTYGIDLTKKRVLIESRLAHELHQRGFTNFHQYLDAVRSDKTGSEVTTMLNKLTTNLSFFMRENEHFTYLAQQVLPFFEKTRKNNEFRIWSAGCSTGQEAYNIAMVIDEYFGSRKGKWDTTILATDISMRVLSKAQQGIYTEAELKDLPPAWRTKYFTALPKGNYQVCDRIRKEVVFRPGNLMEPFHFKRPFDLIFCRNVMIYFDAPTKDSIINKFYDWTSPGGYLFIGHSESVGSNTRYSYIQPAIYQRRS